MEVPNEAGTPFMERHLEGSRSSADKIAVVRVEGIITSQGDSHVGHDGMVGDIREQLRVAQEDESVKAIILRVDSPGGEVLASDEIYRAVKAVRDGHPGNKKPVICSMGSLAASGGYYSAMGSGYVIADELTITGSIGVIMETLNYKDLFDKIGLKLLVFKSGEYKDILNGDREPTIKEKELVQGLIMETYEQFLDIVAKERKLDPEQLRNGIADGRIFSGKQALAHKLVDQTGNFHDAVVMAEKKAGISNARVVDYVVPFTLRNLLGFVGESKAPRIQVDVAPGALKLEKGKLYYLSLHLF